jgi:hypothetical protein
LIGARFYSKGYESKFGRLNQSFYTARDLLGHGTPTLSIAGGNFVSGANVLCFGNGTAKGGSPRSHMLQPTRSAGLEQLKSNALMQIL